MKHCRHCDQDKPADAFTRNQRMNDGLSSWCKACHKAATRKWRAEHGAEYLARRRRKEAKERGEAMTAAGAAIRERLRGG